MQNRVIPKAEEIGADYYKPRKQILDDFLKTNDKTRLNEMRLERNKNWINKQMDDGAEIYDIGINPNRSGGRSDSYKMEIDEIQKRNYPTNNL